MNILTGNDLASGDVIWWTGDGWSRHVEDAIDAAHEPGVVGQAARIRPIERQRLGEVGDRFAVRQAQPEIVVLGGDLFGALVEPARDLHRIAPADHGAADDRVPAEQ